MEIRDIGSNCGRLQLGAPEFQPIGPRTACTLCQDYKVTSSPSDLRLLQGEQESRSGTAMHVARKAERYGLFGAGIRASLPAEADGDFLARASNRGCRDLLLSSAVAR